MEITDLPAVNACLNSISTLLLTAGYLFIRRGQVERHRLAMAGAFVTSCVFLTSYLIYHSQAGSVPFTKQGWVRPVYFTILISHIILAAAIVPLALVTLYHAWLRAFRQASPHRPLDVADLDVRLDHRRGDLSDALSDVSGTAASLHFSPPDGRSTRKKAVIRVSCLVIRENHGRGLVRLQKKCLTASEP